MNRDRRRNQPHRPYGLTSGGAPTMISEACILVLFQLISRPNADDSVFMSSKAKMRTSNISAIIETSSAKTRSVNTSWEILTQAHTYEASVNGATVVCYWIITTRHNAGNEQWCSDSQKPRSGIKCILALPWTFGCTDYFCCWNSPALCHARMQSNMTHWLAYIGIIGNLQQHDVYLKAFSDIPYLTL